MPTWYWFPSGGVLLFERLRPRTIYALRRPRHSECVAAHTSSSIFYDYVSGKSTKSLGIMIVSMVLVLHSHP